jgi:hypothetical protein
VTTLVDPLVCLSHRESPEDGAPLCGAWLSEHCPCCSLCPGLHSDDCTFPFRSATYPAPEASDAR